MGWTLILFLSGLVPSHVGILGDCQNCQEYATYSRLSRGHSLFGQTLRVIQLTNYAITPTWAGNALFTIFANKKELLTHA